MTTATLTGLTAGTWTIDPVHSAVAFQVRHLMVSKVRGSFDEFSGQVVVAEDGTPSVTAEIVVDSFSTKNAQRDGHVRSADFLEVEKYPTMTFRSTSVHGTGSDFTLRGELTLHGVTREVELETEFNGVNPGMGHGPVAGFEATTTINRKDFGIDIEMPLEGGGVVVGDKVQVTLESSSTRPDGPAPWWSWRGGRARVRHRGDPRHSAPTRPGPHCRSCPTGRRPRRHCHRARVVAASSRLRWNRRSQHTPSATSLSRLVGAGQ